MYYLQNRYYDPEIGRFINGDAFVATGQGLLGNNMFAYCLNNPVAFVDPSGTCSYKSSLSGWVDCGKKDCKKSSKYIEDEVLRKTVQVLDAVIQNIEAGIAIGLGMNGTIQLMEIVSIDIGIRYDLISIGYCDGSFYSNQEYFSGMDVQMLESHIFDLHSEHGVRKNTFDGHIDPWQEVEPENIWTISGEGLYLAAGGRFFVGLDVISLVEDFRDIF